MSYSSALAFCGRLFVLLWVAGAIFCSIVSILSCQIFSYETKDLDWSDGWNTTLNAPFDTLPTASFGLFAYSELTTSDENFLLGDECTAYVDWQKIGQNNIFQVAQWCAIFAPLAAFLAWLQLFLEWCFCRLYGSFCLISALLLIASGLQASTFLLVADTDFCFENDCTIGLGAFYSVSAVGGYIIAAAMAPNLLRSPNETQRGCCIYTRPKNDSDVERQQIAQEFVPIDGRSHLLRREESTSIVIQQDGKVEVSVRTPHEYGPDTVETYLYPSEEAAREAGHTVGSWNGDNVEEGEFSDNSSDTPMTSNESPRGLLPETEPDSEEEDFFDPDSEEEYEPYEYRSNI